MPQDNKKIIEPIKPRVKIRLEKTENCIILRTFSKARYNKDFINNKEKGYSIKPQSGSNHFYITKDSIYEGLIKTGSLITKDCYSYCRLGICNPVGKNPLLEIELTWLDSNGSSCSGNIERLSIDYQKFVDFIESTDKEVLTLLDVEYEMKPVINILSTANIQNAIHNKAVRKKFGRIMMWMKNKQCEDIYIYDDWCNEFSFYFVAYTNKEYQYNGGIIFHKNYKTPDNLGKGKYSVHT